MYAAEIGHAKVDEQQQQNLPDDAASDHTTTGLGKNPMSEDDLKAPYAIDSPVCLYHQLYSQLWLTLFASV